MLRAPAERAVFHINDLVLLYGGRVLFHHATLAIDKGSWVRLADLLNRYNEEVEFETSGHQTGRRLKIKDVYRVMVLDW